MACARVCTREDRGVPQETTDPPGDFAGDGLSRKTNNTDGRVFLAKRIIKTNNTKTNNTDGASLAKRIMPKRIIQMGGYRFGIWLGEGVFFRVPLCCSCPR